MRDDQVTQVRGFADHSHFSQTFRRSEGETPSHWLTWFNVAGVEDTVKKAEQLGGSQVLPPMDDQVTRWAHVLQPAVDTAYSAGAASTYRP